MISWTVVGMLVAIMIGLAGISLFSFISSPSGSASKATPQTLTDASSSRSQPPVSAEDSRARAAVQANASKKATKDAPFENSLGMRFVPLPGRDALMSVWDTRVKDFRAYAEASGYRQQGGISILKLPTTKDGKGYTLTFELDAEASWEKPGFPQTAAHAVVGVSWEEAKAFCGWLTAKERGEGKIGKGQEYRLPTDEEWSEAVGGARYPWGNEWPPPVGAGNYEPSLKVDTYANTSPVGQLSANRLGLYDMGGNVCQWCEDWYRASMNESAVLEKIPALKADGGGQKYRVLRGGSWCDFSPERLLSSFRYFGSPVFRGSFFGFRCVLVGGSSR
ncbi:MAG: SUMF1/EgtB/PvdO family nonheme iron enzyme [Verrucomicrobiae bacterium]